MCGIAGIISLGQRPVPAGAVKTMCDIIAHRGPDDAGYAFFRPSDTHRDGGGRWAEFADQEFIHTNEHLPPFEGQYYRDELATNDFMLAFGHRRLSIIDLTHKGHQPMANSDRRMWITYNGEIYNFPQLRDELISKGHVFRTRTDTEIILQLWERHGEQCLDMLDGMFAFGIYDHSTGVVTLARDSFGVKPLYYTFTKDFCIFASESKAILASGLHKGQIDPAAVAEYFTFQNLFGYQTLLSGIKILPPGHLLRIQVGSGNNREQLRRYHNGFPTAEAGLAKMENIHEQVAETFGDAVKKQLISDVEVGSYLSGGMDSGSIVSVAGRHVPRLLTFTCGFDMTNVNGIEQGFDERRQAEQLSFLLQTEHYDTVLHAGDMPAAMEKISWHMDDPRVGMCHQNWYVAKLASKFVKVCLDGAGGDELFGGYPWRYRHGLNTETFADFDEAYFRYWHRLASPDQMPELLSGDLNKYTPSVRDNFGAILADAPQYDHSLDKTENMLQRAMFFEFKTFLHGYLVTMDRISMAHSLEARVPFLDNDLVKLAWRLPPSLKIQCSALLGEAKGKHINSTSGKMVLRKAMERYLPKEFTRQHKQGFSPPDENWFRGPSMEYIKEILLDQNTMDRPWFNCKTIENNLNDHFVGKQNHRLLIWSLLSFEWLQRHLIDQSVCQRNTE